MTTNLKLKPFSWAPDYYIKQLSRYFNLIIHNHLTLKISQNEFIIYRLSPFSNLFFLLQMEEGMACGEVRGRMVTEK